MNIGKETEYTEFKKSTAETREGIISITSMLNKHGKGELYFGVKDNGDVIGQDIGKDTERKLSQDIAANIRPSVWYETAVKYADDGKSFIEVSFHGEAAPYSAYGKYYQRFADEDRQISDTELERLFKSRQRDYSEWEKADSEEHLIDVDEELLKRVIADGIESGRINRKYTDAAEMLAKLRVYHASTDSLTNAGRVLFSAKRPVLLKTAVYAGTEKTTFIKLNHFEGNVFECINEGISFILSSINWNVKIEGEARRREEPEIPQTAIREICVNAFAHGCYYSNTAFSIEIFSDRVVIYSPGFFPGGFKPEDFAYNAAEPIMLNPAIVSVLFKAGMIESFGSGFERTFTACEAAGIRYAYENTLTGFRFIMYRGRRAKNEKDLSGMEKAVLEQLMEEETLTMREMARTLSRSEKTIARAISGLKEKGYICREGSDNSGYWKIL